MKKLFLQTALVIAGLAFLALFSGCNDDENPVAQDTTNPTIVSITPSDGAENVAITAAITISFSETLDASSVTSASLSLRNGTSVVDGAISISDQEVTFNPTDDLEYATTYTLTVGAVITDEAGNGLSGSVTTSFTTIAAPDVANPIVVSVAPSDNEEDVSLDANIVVEFSEEIDLNSVDDNSLALTTPAFSNNIEATVTIDGNTMTIDPTESFEEEAVYTLELGTGLTDLTGNPLEEVFQSSFTTLSLDTEAPTLVSSSPEQDETGVALDANIVLTFSEEIDMTSVDDNTLMLTVSGVSDLLETTMSVAGSVMTVDTTIDFEEGVTYTISLPAGGLKDLAGNGLDSDFEIAFTAEILDNESPSVLGFSVSNGETGVDANGGITITFSEPVDPNSLADNILFRRGGTTDNLSISFEVSGDDVIVTPDDAMKGNTEYVLDVTVDVTDLAGNPLDFARARVFTTAEVSVTIISTTPENNAVDVEVDQDIVITFSEPIDESSLSVFWAGSASPSITTSVDGAVLTVSVDGDGLTEFETSYVLSIDADDIYGNSMASSQSLSFTTIFVSENFYYFIRNYQTANDGNPEYLGFQQATPQVTYLDNVSQSSNFNLWRFIKNGDGYAIKNLYLEENNFSDQNLFSFPVNVSNKLAYSNTTSGGALWTFDTPTNGVRTMSSQGNLLDGEDLTMTSDQGTSSGYRWWIFSRQPVSVD